MKTPPPRCDRIHSSLRYSAISVMIQFDLTSSSLIFSCGTRVYQLPPFLWSKPINSILKKTLFKPTTITVPRTHSKVSMCLDKFITCWKTQNIATRLICVSFFWVHLLAAKIILICLSICCIYPWFPSMQKEVTVHSVCLGNTIRQGIDRTWYTYIISILTSLSLIRITTS